MPNDNTEIQHTLKRIEDLLTALTKVALRDAMGKHIADKNSKLIYENLDRLTVRQLSKKTGFATGKISGLCQEWERDGLLLKEGKKYRRLF
jgi:hypothetical protein